MPKIADLMSRFSVVAAAHPEHSWYVLRVYGKQISTTVFSA